MLKTRLQRGNMVFYKYDKEAISRLSDDVKIAVLLNKTRRQLQEHLRLNACFSYGIPSCERRPCKLNQDGADLEP